MDYWGGKLKISRNAPKIIYLFTSGSRGGGAPGAPPPNDRGPMIFYAQNAFFFHFFFARDSFLAYF